MNRIEFSDVNRFLASLGLILVGLGFLLPWFLNQNNSSLLIEQDKLQNLTPIAQKIIFEQQTFLMKVNSSMTIIIIILMIMGFGLLTFALIRWSKRQAVLDKIQDEELRSKEIQNLSAKEKWNLIEEEIIHDDENLGKITDKEIESYIQIENIIFFKLSEYFKNNYMPTQNVRIGNYDYDIIFKMKSGKLLSVPFRDRIIEIKFFKSNLEYSKIQDAVTNLILACNHYQTSFKRTASCILIIVYSRKEFEESIKGFKGRLTEYAKEIGINLRINFFNEEDILMAKAADFLNK